VGRFAGKREGSDHLSAGFGADIVGASRMGVTSALRSTAIQALNDSTDT
jgi:hypothetical protein